MAKKVKVPGGGVEGAAKLLSQLDSSHSKRLLDQIASSDPEMAQALQDNLVDFEDLRFLTVDMMRELLKEISLRDLGLALRISSPDLCKHFLSNISSGMKREVEDVLAGPPVKASDAQQAKEDILNVVRKKVENGLIILNPDDGEEMV